MRISQGNIYFSVEENTLTFVNNDKDICIIILTDNAKEYWTKISEKYKDNLPQLEADILTLYKKDNENFGKTSCNNNEVYVMNPTNKDLEKLS
jgi:hypothetical protein